jgi:hypothetical protein
MGRDAGLIKGRVKMTGQGVRLNGGEEATSTDTHGMVAVGDMPTRDREFEALLIRAAQFEKTDSGCKLRGAAVYEFARR